MSNGSLRLMQCFLCVLPTSTTSLNHNVEEELMRLGRLAVVAASLQLAGHWWQNAGERKRWMRGWLGKRVGQGTRRQSRTFDAAVGH
jgi:hypothetical protein